MNDPDQKLRKLEKLVIAYGVIAFCSVAYIAFLWLDPFLPRESPYRGRSTKTISNAKQTATAVLLYASDYDGRLPHSFYNESSLYYILGTGKADIATTANPDGGSLMPNANLAGVLLADIEYPEDTVLIYETTPWPNRDRRVFAFVDGHAAYAPLDEKLLWGREYMRGDSLLRTDSEELFGRPR